MSMLGPSTDCRLFCDEVNGERYDYVQVPSGRPVNVIPPLAVEGGRKEGGRGEERREEERRGEEKLVKRDSW